MDPSVGSVGRIGTVTALKKQPWGSRTPVQAPVWAAGELNAKVAALRVVNEEVISTFRGKSSTAKILRNTAPTPLTALHWVPTKDMRTCHMHTHCLFYHTCVGVL